MNQDNRVRWFLTSQYKSKYSRFVYVYSFGLTASSASIVSL